MLWVLNSYNLQKHQEMFYKHANGALHQLEKNKR
jgi:hypothetical protein